jgi:multiple sugar transport system ATP-binding protein
VQLAAYEGSDRLTTCPDAVLGVRPEHVAIHPDGADGIPATVELDEPMGSESLVWLKLADKPFTVKTTAEHGLHNGQPVKLIFDIHRASLFDKASGVRL